MYIPTSFFSSQGSCVTVSTSTITGSGTVTSGSFISGGYFWDYWQFNNTADPINSDSSSLAFSASFNILSGSTGQAKLFLVGGGGAGGYGACVLRPSTCDATSGAGGGGGGIVYYNQFPLASGSYTISVGYGGGNPLNGLVQGRTGENTTFTFTYPYSPFTSSVITAYGGGKGGYVVQNAFSIDPNILVQGISGGSAGGAVCNSDGNGRNTTIQAGYDGFGGLNGANQGNDAGMVSGSGGGVMAGGGGGAGTASPAVDITFGQRTGVGGDGALYNLTGTPLYYAAGGGGAWGQSLGNSRGESADGLGTAGIGNGGQGKTLSYPQGTTATNGTVIIAIPRCLSAFSCKNFAITGSNGTLSYLNCGFPFVTSSKLSSNQDEFTACLLTYSGSNTPVLLTGTTTSSVISDCSAQLTSSTACDCTYIRAVPNSGTQTITLFPCNGSGSVTQSVPPAGKFFCVENYSSVSFPSGAVTTYGACTTGSCEGIQYTSSFVNCTSVLATAGGSGGTLTYVPCGSGSAIQLALSASESRSICAAYTSSFLSLTGAGSTFTNYSTCSYQFPPAIVSWSFDEINQNGQFILLNGGTTLASLTADGSGSAALTGSRLLSASLSPVAYAGTSGSLFMNLNISGSNVNINKVSNINNTLSASVTMDYGQTYIVSASVRWDAFPAVTSSLWSYIDISNAASYNGSGSTIQDLTSNNNDATIAYPTSWSYAQPDYLGISTPTLGLKNTYFEVGGYVIGSYYQGVAFNSGFVSNNFTLLISWYGQNGQYNNGDEFVPIFQDPDSDPGNNQFGMNAWNQFSSSAVGIITNEGSQQTKPVANSASTSSWHVSQVSWNDTTSTIRYCLDGITGSFSGVAGQNNTMNFEIFPSSLSGLGNNSFGSGSAFQVAVIYTGSLTEQQMLDNYNALKNRYGL